ncbi:MAG: TonB family protein [Lentimicrobium sp.]|nr:TonB family protein [Lentimicrobium sp.]
MENEPDYKIFTPSGCLSPEGMAFYVQGNLSAKDAALVSDHLKHCEMCALAVEGYRLSVPGEFNEDLELLEASFNHEEEVTSEMVNEIMPSVSSDFEGPRFPRLSRKEIREFSDTILRGSQTGGIEPQSIPTKVQRKAGFFSRHKPVLLAASVILLIAVTGGWLFFEIYKTGKQREFASAIEKEETKAGTVLPAEPADSAEAEPAPASPVAIKDEQHPSVGIPKPEQTTAIEIVSDDAEIDAEIPTAAEEDIAARRMPPLDVKTLQEPSIQKSEGYAVAESLPVQKAETIYIEGVQLSENKRMKGEAVAEEEVAEAEIFMVVEEAPVFPGGEEARIRFLQENIRYPQLARESSIQGTVYVTFVVELNGAINDVRVLRGIGGGCDEEAVRVIKAMPKWIPGKQRGKPVRVQFNMPVKFILTGNLVPEN